VARVRFSYLPEKLLKKIKLPAGGGLAKHEAWADAILPADAEAQPIEEGANQRPLIVVGIFLGIVMTILIGRLALLQLIGGDHNAALADGNRLRTKVTRAQRGVMYDRNGVLIARNQPTFDITATPTQLPRKKEDREKEYAQASSLLGVPVDQLRSKAEEKGLTYSQPLLIASGVARDKALAFDAAGSVAGISLDINTVRQYLDGGSLGSVLGYTGRISAEEYAKVPSSEYQQTDYIGKNGLERAYEKQLRGSNGSEQTEVDVQQRPVKILASKPSLAGQNLVLTLDKELQDELVKNIQTQLEASGSGRGAGVVLNPQTGEILAMASLPGYDNNLFAEGISSSEYSKLTNNPNQPLFNKAFQGAYAVGSIIKPLTATAALTEKVINPLTTVEDKGSLELKNIYDPSITYTFKTWEPGGLGVVNVTKALALSSNVFFFTVGGGYGPIKGLGIDRLSKWYERFGLGQQTGIDLPSEASGLVPNPDIKKKNTGEAWTIGDTYNTAVGQGGLLASPLQMAAATAAVANGGTLYKPYLVSKITDEAGKTISTTKPDVTRKDIASADVLNIVRSGMRDVVVSGTACCKIEQEVPVKVAGKTGTAETDPEHGKKPNAWFTSFAPYDNPRIVTVILIEGSGEGAQYAAPATRELLKWYFTHR
jgi:penicillin-binding protein 2